tara:strand:- start:342 stop:1169 length:828 start_codon:yes stop_codon:yes gene_type:complete
MSNYPVIKVSDVEGYNIVYPITYYAPYQPAAYASTAITFPTIIASAGEQDMAASDYSEVQTTEMPSGWFIFCTSIDVDGAYNGADGSFSVTKSLSEVLSAQEVSPGNIVIVKNNAGNAYLPEWNYNGIGDLVNGEGYQIKLVEAQSFTFKGNPLTVEDDDGNRAYGSIIYFLAGWNIKGNPLPYADGLTDELFEHPTWPIILNGALNSDFNNVPFISGDVSMDGSIVIIKNNAGMAFLPEWSYDGIGALIPGHAYQIKIEASGYQGNAGSVEITM